MQYEKSKRNNYTADFKREAVELVLSSGRNVPQIAAELGVSISNLRRWKREYQAQGNQAFPGPGRLPSDEEEMRGLRWELERVKQERDILKKAVGIFSQRPT
jgi:transposase